MLNPVIVAVLLLCVLCLLKINVLLSIVFPPSTFHYAYGYCILSFA